MAQTNGDLSHGHPMAYLARARILVHIDEGGNVPASIEICNGLGRHVEISGWKVFHYRGNDPFPDILQIPSGVRLQWPADRGYTPNVLFTMSSVHGGWYELRDASENRIDRAVYTAAMARVGNLVFRPPPAEEELSPIYGNGIEVHDPAQLDDFRSQPSDDPDAISPPSGTDSVDEALAIMGQMRLSSDLASPQPGPELPVPGPRLRPALPNLATPVFPNRRVPSDASRVVPPEPRSPSSPTA